MVRWKLIAVASAIMSVAVVGAAVGQDSAPDDFGWHRQVLRHLTEISERLARMESRPSTGVLMSPTPIVFASPHGTVGAAGFISPPNCHPMPISGSQGPSCVTLTDSYCKAMGHSRAANVEYERPPQRDTVNRIVALVCTSARNLNP